MFLEVRIDFQAGLQLGIKKNELEALFKDTVENKSHFCVYVHETAHLLLFCLVLLFSSLCFDSVMNY